MFITFEGIEGSGKSTQLKNVAAELDKQNIPFVTLREPGGTPIGDQIRALLLDPAFSEMTTHTEALLYAASRAQLVTEVIRPYLTNGKVVLCDRYIDSTFAYQGNGSSEFFAGILGVNQFATGGLKPDRTYLFDCPVKVGLARIKSRGLAIDRMEAKEIFFHEQVRKSYLELADTDTERFIIIDACQSEREISQHVLADLVPLLHKG